MCSLQDPREEEGRRRGGEGEEEGRKRGGGGEEEVRRRGGGGKEKGRKRIYTTVYVLSQF